MEVPTVHFYYKGKSTTRSLSDISPREIISSIGWDGKITGKGGKLVFCEDAPQVFGYFGIRIQSEENVVEALVLLIKQKKLETLSDFLLHIGSMQEDYIWLRRRHFNSDYEESVARERDDDRYNTSSIFGSINFIKKFWSGYSPVPLGEEYHWDGFSSNGITNLYMANAHNVIAIRRRENIKRITRVIIYKDKNVIHLDLPKIGRFIVNLTREYTMSAREILDCILEDSALPFILNQEPYYFADSQKHYHLIVERGQRVIADDFLSIFVACINKHILSNYVSK